ncbi:MAG: DegT/DnrJ/EryC1/StrS family aminotransferase, partial [bacterium]
ALYYALRVAGAGVGDEVIIQAYTCVTVPNAVLATGAKPIYCDVDESLNLDPQEVGKKITNKTKAIIVQHTFGNPEKIEEIREVCGNNTHPNPPLKGEGNKGRIILIEDCAHSLGARYNGRLVGTFGDISMFSFGRDKVISSVNGGMLCVNNEALMSKHTPHPSQEGNLRFPSFVIIARNLMYPIIAQISLKWYNKRSIGKVIMYVSKKLRLFPLILSDQEKNGMAIISPSSEEGGRGRFSKVGTGNLNCAGENPTPTLPSKGREARISKFYKMPNVLSFLFLRQFKKIDKYNAHRCKIAKYYNEALAGSKFKLPEIWNKSEPVYLRYTIFTDQAVKIIKEAKQKGIYLGDWYRQVIAPKGVNFRSVGYEQHKCSKAEKYAEMTVNLPNHYGIGMEEAGRVIEEIEKLGN